MLYGGCAVLLYHRVSSLDFDPQLLSVTPEHFEEHVIYLKQNYRVLSVSEFYEILVSKRRFPSKSVLLTFDDGYADNYLNALPILERHNLQALFYVATATVNTQGEFWWDAVERIVFEGTRPSMVNTIQIGKTQFVLNSDFQNLYRALLPALRMLAPDLRDDKINELADAFKCLNNRESHRAMSWEELKSMQRSTSAVIGAHTHLHPSLAALTPEEQKSEILKSKFLLETNLGININHFSYPFGTRTDYTEETIRICREAGFKMVAANYPQLVNRKSDLFAFPRNLIRDWNIEDFKRNLLSFYR